MKNVSVIMPLYNVSKYLEESLDSVLGQSFVDFELICVNDASVDDTMKILQKYQKKDCRIRIFSNAERCGAAVSRNLGISKAVGKYLVFLDGDDIFDEMLLEKAYKTIEEHNADIVLYQYQHMSSDFIHEKCSVPHTKEFKNRYCRAPFSILDCDPWEMLQFRLGPCDKMYRSAVIKENHLIFQDLPCSNDIYFVYMALLVSRRLIVLDDDNVMLHARDHFGEDRISINRDPMCNYQALMKIGEELIKRNQFAKLYAHFYYRAFYSLRDAFLVDHDKERANKFYDFLQKEGINRICSLDISRYDRLDNDIKDAFLQYSDKNFESGWYREENILKLYLLKNSEKVTALFNEFEKSGKRTAIWGAGQNGKILLDFCVQHHLRVDAVIDKAEEKRGQKLVGQTVRSLQAVGDMIQVIVISAGFIYEDVVKEVGNRTIEVIDINAFLCIN